MRRACNLAYDRGVQKQVRTLATLLVVCALFAPLHGLTQTRDGQHDFDFNFGTWQTHIKRLQHPLTRTTAWVEYSGQVTVRKVWGGSASLEEIEANGAGHLEIMNLRMYDPKSHQWSLNGTGSGDGMLGSPMYGDFRNGRGVFYDQEPFNGRTVLVRQTFSDITAHTYSFEQAYSSDGGTTWQPNFVAHLTRLSALAPSEGALSIADTSHDFDFNYGTWMTHIKSLHQAPDGSKTWNELNGTVAVRKIWNGRALMEEIKAANASGGFEGLTLLLYDPQSHQWSQTYADRSDGTFDPSMIGDFKDGRGELVGQARYGGKAVLMRDAWSDIKAEAHDFEVAYSDDGGRHWQPTFIAALRRAGPGL